MTKVQKFAYAFGAIYLVVGIAGFFVTGFSGFASTEGDTLIAFDVNPLHNIVHLLLGVVWLGAGGREATSRTISILFGAVLALVGLIGLFIVDSSANILAVNHADNILHLATAALALYFGLAGRTPAPEAA